LDASPINSTLIQLYRNEGQARAIIAGLHEAKGDYIATMDDDLEYSPFDIDLLISKLNSKNLDVVIGKPHDDNRAMIRRLGSNIHNKINSLISKQKNIHLKCFRVMTKEFNSNLIKYKTHNPMVGSMILKTTQRVENIDVKTYPSKRKSNYTFVKLVGQFLLNMQNHSSLPLNYITAAGTVITFFTVLAIGFITFQYFTDIPWKIQRPGWTSIVLLISFFSGFIIFSIGTIGQYVYHILNEVNHAPRFHIRSKTVCKKQNDIHINKSA